MTGNKNLIKNIKKCYPREVRVADGRKLSANLSGEAVFTNKKGKQFSFNVLYVPSLSYNLISVNKLVNSNFVVSFRDNICEIVDKKSMNVYFLAKRFNGIYIFSGDTVAASSDDRVADHKSLDFAGALIQHQRLGHLGKSTDFCTDCAVGKFPRRSMKKKTVKIPSTERLAIIHSDLVGPLPNSLGGSKYLLTFTDDYSRKVFVYLLKRKSEVYQKVLNFVQMVETQTGNKLKILQCDNGGEYINNKLIDFFTSKGIILKRTAPYTPEQNGIAERINRTIFDRVRCMLSHAKLDKSFWGEAALTAVYLINKHPTSALNGQIPDELWFNKKVSLNHLRVFGCEAYAHIPKQKRKSKLDPRSKKCILVGYDSFDRSYRLYDFNDPKRVTISSSVTFNENSFPGSKCKFNNTLNNHFIYFPEVKRNNEDSNMPDSHQNQLTPSSIEVAADDSFASADSNEFTQENEQLSPRQVINTEQTHPDSSHHYNLRERKVVNYSCLVANLNDENHEPRHFKEAVNSINAISWYDAMKVELQSFKDYQVWELVTRPNNKNVVKSRWVYKIKRDADFNIVRYKARLVAKGFTQRFGEDYNETFSPVVRHSSIRILLALSVDLHLNVDHLDVQTAFLNSDLDEVIFMEQPEGFTNGNTNQVYKLKKAVYGLKQASRAWYSRVKDVLIKLGFIQCNSDQCIFILKKDKYVVYLALYVDDFIICYNNVNIANSVKMYLNKHFQIKDLGSVRNVLGMQVFRTKNEMHLSQSHYINQILDKYNMTDCKPIGTPLELNAKFENKTNAEPDEKNYPYRELVGSLMYLSVMTRPDITFAVSYLSQYNSCFQREHWLAAKRVLRYLKGTINMGLLYTANQETFCLHGYCDADWANNAPDCKSFTGYVYQASGKTVTWACKKQTSVALSSCEAEYYAISEGSKEAIYLLSLYKELLDSTQLFPSLSLNNLTVELYNDNQSAQKLVSNPVFHKRTKHIQIKYHFIREAVNCKYVNLNYMQTDKMVADILTKPLSKFKHLFCCKGLGVMLIK